MDILEACPSRSVHLSNCTDASAMRDYASSCAMGVAPLLEARPRVVKEGTAWQAYVVIALKVFKFDAEFLGVISETVCAGWKARDKGCEREPEALAYGSRSVLPDVGALLGGAVIDGPSGSVYSPEGGARN